MSDLENWFNGPESETAEEETQRSKKQEEEMAAIVAAAKAGEMELDPEDEAKQLEAERKLKLEESQRKQEALHKNMKENKDKKLEDYEDPQHRGCQKVDAESPKNVEG
jgi:hypothetical protein